MGVHYEGVTDPKTLREVFQAELPPQVAKVDLWPGDSGLMIRLPVQRAPDSDAVVEREAVVGLFGLVPSWAADPTINRNTSIARAETVATKPSFRDAWKNAQHCIIPAHAIYQPDWRSGKETAARIERVDGMPMGLAGLWSTWRSPKGEWVHSYTLLTIKAVSHQLMNKLHKVTDEKRMVVILPDADQDAWLRASADKSMAFLLPYPAELMRDAAGHIDLQVRSIP
jgi:putative SOS response-associated peptidase YedK